MRSERNSLTYFLSAKLHCAAGSTTSIRSYLIIPHRCKRTLTIIDLSELIFVPRG
jgi:hypothetical protein